MNTKDEHYEELKQMHSDIKLPDALTSIVVQLKSSIAHMGDTNKASAEKFLATCQVELNEAATQANSKNFWVFSIPEPAQGQTTEAAKNDAPHSLLQDAANSAPRGLRAESGTVVGKAVDENNRPLAKAEVLLGPDLRLLITGDTGSNRVLRTFTDEKGEFAFSAVPFNMPFYIVGEFEDHGAVWPEPTMFQNVPEPYRLTAKDPGTRVTLRFKRLTAGAPAPSAQTSPGGQPQRSTPGPAAPQGAPRSRKKRTVTIAPAALGDEKQDIYDAAGSPGKQVELRDSTAVQFTVNSSTTGGALRYLIRVWAMHKEQGHMLNQSQLDMLGFKLQGFKTTKGPIEVINYSEDAQGDVQFAQSEPITPSTTTKIMQLVFGVGGAFKDATGWEKLAAAGIEADSLVVVAMVRLMESKEDSANQVVEDGEPVQSQAYMYLLKKTA